MNGYIKKSYLEADLIRRGFYPAIVKRALEEMPCADVVEVVRCRDCIRSKPFFFEGSRVCERFAGCVKDDDYCPGGIRKGEQG